jgi:hypothetical protein
MAVGAGPAGGEEPSEIRPGRNEKMSGAAVVTSAFCSVVSLRSAMMVALHSAQPAAPCMMAINASFGSPSVSYACAQQLILCARTVRTESQ